jgi:hypothetical protein
MNTGAHPSRAGWNQSGGAHFIIMTNLEATPGQYINTLTSAGSNSGGAFVGATFASNSAPVAFGAGTTNHSNAAIAAVGAGKLLKDMGKTVVSSGRTFRKFQAVGTGSVNFANSFGVQGGNPGVPTAANAGYADFYLEVGREGSAGATAAPAPILRYF